MIEWLDKVHQAQEALRDEYYGLRDLAASLERVGMGSLAREVGMRAERIFAAQKQVGEVVGQMLTEQIHGRQKAFHDTVGALLTGALEADKEAA
jgi:hypothetical protein